MGRHEAHSDTEYGAYDVGRDDLTFNEYTQCTFTGCDLSGADLRGASFFDCTFSACNISNATVEGARFCDCTITGSKLMGIRFDQTNQLLFSITLADSTVRLCTFTGMNLEKMRISRCVMEDCDFCSASLRGAQFLDSSLGGTNFDGADLRGADMRTASTYSINPESTSVSGARFSCPEVLRLLDYLDISIEVGCKD